MDPFTEKLLERTRARRENLQKKLAERSNAANRQVVKRPREPLTDTNVVISDEMVSPFSDACDVPSDCIPVSTIKRPFDAQPAASPSVSSETSLGRRGRLANLAATIGSWEDDVIRDAAASIFPASLQKADSVSSPQKCSNQAATVSSTHLKTSVEEPALLSSQQKASSSMSALQSPQKHQALSKGPDVSCSPQKPELCAKPSSSDLPVSREKVTTARPISWFLPSHIGVKSLRERINQSSPARVGVQSSAASVSPNTRSVQERLRAAQATNTSTADITMRQKLERESELAQICSRFQQRSKMWKDKEGGADAKVGQEASGTHRVNKVMSSEPPDELPAPYKTSDARGDSPPVLTSSPLKVAVHTTDRLTEKTPEEKREDQSINSTVINELFGDLEQSEDHSCDEEDALNISSMSLLTPLAETVAAVVNSPEKRMMTSTPANSFIMKSTPPDDVAKAESFQTSSDGDAASVSSEDHKLPYSIDAYRSTRVKNTERPSVKQVIVRREDVSKRAEEPRASSLFSVKQKIKILTNEINLQQTVIYQASQALNCCTDEEHGKGSQVEAEAERLLLVASEKREALKVELDQLRGSPGGRKEGPAAPQPTASKGCITLQELRLPLKADFVCSTANKPESTKHSFFIMIRAGPENIVATPLATTHRGLSGDTLTFPTKFTISDVDSGFDISVEVYCLVQKREICSDKKKKANKSKAITPKKFLTITVIVASPGGPNAVRTSNFALIGAYKLTLASIGKTQFALEKVPFLCPLEGHIYLKLHCEVGSKVEERGFLTMFEDVSGFGAWHRRWCVLSGYCISYWTYPDDEKRKVTIRDAVEPASREFCARPNTLELITVRPRRDDDRETLVSQCQNTMCVTRNWLSADTKEERNLWMKKLNQILVDLRMWQPDACNRPLPN
uniref:Anillin n=1 Tax=Neolamprologus brichardi TaxID=32507 RepID=A0A3Q4HTC8_NEOBR